MANTDLLTYLQMLENNWETQQRYRHKSSNQIKKINTNNGKQ